MSIDNLNPIVASALALRQAHQDWTDLKVLDAAMQPYIGTQPDFEATGAGGVADWLMPPSAFAGLLRGAFGADLIDEAAHAESPEWHRVVDAFGERYKLWQ